MTTLKISTALVLLSTIQSTLVLAQSFSEPAAFAAQHPDRDVLNGGGLTPEARASAGLENVRGAYGGLGISNPVSTRGTHRRHR
jgi:hypothetical protein